MKFKTLLLIIGIMTLYLSFQLFADKNYGGAMWWLLAGCFAIWSRDNLEDV